MPPRKRKFSPVSTTGPVAGDVMGGYSADPEIPEEPAQEPAETTNVVPMGDESSRAGKTPQRSTEAPKKARQAPPVEPVEEETPPEGPLAPAAEDSATPVDEPSSLLPPLPNFARLASRLYTTLSEEEIERISRDLDVELLQIVAVYKKMLARQEKFVRKVRHARSQGFPEPMLEDLARKHNWELPPKD